MLPKIDAMYTYCGKCLLNTCEMQCLHALPGVDYPLVDLDRAYDAYRMLARDGIINLIHTEAKLRMRTNAISAKYVPSLRVVYFTSMRVFYSGPVCW